MIFKHSALKHLSLAGLATCSTSKNQEFSMICLIVILCLLSTSKHLATILLPKIEIPLNFRLVRWWSVNPRHTNLMVSLVFLPWNGKRPTIMEYIITPKLHMSTLAPYQRSSSKISGAWNEKKNPWWMIWLESFSSEILKSGQKKSSYWREVRNSHPVLSLECQQNFPNFFVAFW